MGMYQTSEYLEPKEGLEMFNPHQGQFVEPVGLQFESEPQYVEQYVVATNEHETKIGKNQGPVEVVPAGQNMAAPPKSPMIFVVPNSGQKQQVNRKPLLINTTGEQKKPVVISKVQSNGASVGKAVESPIKQGVIAQINGQKVLLVPKKKSEGSGDQHRVLVMSQQGSTTTVAVTGAGQQQQQQQYQQQQQQQQQQLQEQQHNKVAWTGQHQTLSAGAQQLINSSSMIVTQQGVVQIQKSSGLHQSSVRLTSVAGSQQPQVTNSRVVAVNTRAQHEAKQSCLTEIDPNTVQNNTENLTDSNKSNILEQAMHEVFPSDIDFTEGTPGETLTDISAQVVDDLYNPMRSPLKNRNKILCEVLGIDS